MTGARRSGGSYFKPHNKSCQAFLEECVVIWCEADAGKSHQVDPDLEACVKAHIHADVEGRLGTATSPETVDYFARVEFAAFQNELIARSLVDEINKMKTPRPKKGNKRREVPVHLPLRPSRAVIAFVATRIKVQNPTATKNSIYSKTADYLRDGIPKSEASRRLSVKNVRDAVESHGIFDNIETIAARHMREFERVKAKGIPHLWDCGVYDWMVIGRRLAKMRGYEDEQLRIALFRNLIIWPMQSFERLYGKARAGRRFAGLFGADLARAIDAALDLRSWVLADLDASTADRPQTGGRTANAAG
jgi:hypothetical protein